MAYKIPSSLHPDGDGISFANFVLGDTPSGRLHKALVETGKAAQVFGFPLTGLYPGLHIFGAAVKKGDPIEPVRDELVRLVEGFGAAPATAEEIARARKSFENEIEKSLANHESIGVQLSEYIALGDWRLFFLSRDDLPKVTPEAVAKAASAYYRRDNRIVGLYTPEDNPQRAEIPAAPTVAEVMKDFKGKAQVSAAEAFEPTQENIDATHQARAVRRPQGGAAYEEESRRDGERVAHTSHGRREEPLRPEDGGPGGRRRCSRAGRRSSRASSSPTRSSASRSPDAWAAAAEASRRRGRISRRR